MTRKTPASPQLWRALNLAEDWLSTGFARSHPDLAVAEAAQPSERAGRPKPSEDPSSRTAAFSENPASRAAALAEVAAECASCARCGLAANRTTVVPGEGALDAPVLFVGEGPGEEEDRTGRPFVGAAGKYLDKWIPSIGLDRKACFIANCVKCRPPSNREPHPDEIAACLPFLERQIRAVRPRAICCLGRIAAHTLLGTTASLGELRGSVRSYGGIPLVVTYHPSAVLRDPASLRKPVWEDLKLLKSLLNE